MARTTSGKILKRCTYLNLRHFVRAVAVRPQVIQEANRKYWKTWQASPETEEKLKDFESKHDDSLGSELCKFSQLAQLIAHILHTHCLLLANNSNPIIDVCDCCGMFRTCVTKQHAQLCLWCTAAQTAKAALRKSQGLKPLLHHVYETRARSYRDAVQQFVEGYKEGFAGQSESVKSNTAAQPAQKESSGQTSQKGHSASTQNQFDGAPQ